MSGLCLWVRRYGKYARKAAEAKLDDQFLVSVQNAKDELRHMLRRLEEKQRADDYYAARAFPREDDMDQILRYDKALQKKFDWALQNLLESQQRRRKTQERVSTRV